MKPQSNLQLQPVYPNTPVNVNTPGKSPKAVPYEHIKIQVHRKAVCVCILIVDPLVIILPLDEPLVALGGFLPADEEEFPEHILTSCPPWVSLVSYLSSSNRGYAGHLKMSYGVWLGSKYNTI